MTRHGLYVMQGGNRITFLGTLVTYQTYGGWGDHVMFGGFADDDTAIAATAGDATGSRPTSGPATWRGVMVGADYARNEAFQGDAALTADFGAGSVDVPFTADGFASGHRVGRFVKGTFHGPGHTEAGGVFETECGNRIGAFGTRRE